MSSESGEGAAILPEAVTASWAAKISCTRHYTNAGRFITILSGTKDAGKNAAD
jgi:hypothetical protein